MDNVFKRLGSYSVYEINREGIVRKIKSKSELIPQKISLNGEKEYVRVVHNGKPEFVRIGRLFATAFVKRETPKHNSLICKDGNWQNLSEDNFVWIDPKNGFGLETDIMWKAIKGYEKLYIINEFGDIKSIKTQRKLNSFIVNGKLCVSLHKQGIRRTVSVTKLVADAFLEGTPTRHIKHLDGDESNCHYTNLVWSSHPKKKHSENKTPLVEYTIDGDFIAEWDSINQAARAKNVDSRNIYSCCIGQNRTAGGSVWRYKGDVFNKFEKDPSLLPMEGENFVAFEEAPGYEISNKGRFRNLKRGGAIHKITARGYVEFRVNRTEYHKKFGNLVAKYFLPNPHGYKRVEFIDGNPANCDVDNLKWVK